MKFLNLRRARPAAEPTPWAKDPERIAEILKVQLHLEARIKASEIVVCQLGGAQLLADQLEAAGVRTPYHVVCCLPPPALDPPAPAPVGELETRGDEGGE